MKRYAQSNSTVISGRMKKKEERKRKKREKNRSLIFSKSASLVGTIIISKTRSCFIQNYCRSTNSAVVGPQKDPQRYCRSTESHRAAVEPQRATELL